MTLPPYPTYKDSVVPWLAEIRADIAALEAETDGLLDEIVGEFWR